MARVALDAMGGDHAPTETVAGAIAATEEGYDVVLVGDEAVLEAAPWTQTGGDLPIVHASQIIGMGDNPAKAIRDMPDSSIVRAAKLVRDGEAQALVSAGSTGAALAAAAIVIGRLPGVLRPTIASVFPDAGHPTPSSSTPERIRIADPNISCSSASWDRWSPRSTSIANVPGRAPHHRRGAWQGS